MKQSPNITEPSKGLAEFLIGPPTSRTQAILRAFEKEMRERGLSGHAIRIETKFAFGIIVRKYEQEVSSGVSVECGEHREDQWPEALGSRITWSTDEIKVDGDHFSIRPIFYGTGSEGDYIGSSLQWLAAVLNSQIDPVHLSELLLLSYNLDNRTLLPSVHRFNSGDQWLKVNGEQATIIQKNVGISSLGGTLGDLTGPESQKLLRGVAERVAEFMDEGACLELSGGLDSRCNLALGNWLGSRPKFAFTLGEEGTEEVRLARELCKKSGVEHHRIGVPLNIDAVSDDTDDYLQASSYQVNAASYCWMPELFRMLAPLRDIQLCGQNAETSWSYTPFDVFGKIPWVVDRWVQSRLIHSGNQTANLLGEEIEEEGKNLVATSSKELLKRAGGSFRSRTDEFYTLQRCRQWSSGPSNAARFWYRNQLPLLDSRVAEWSWRGRMCHRSFRVNLMRLSEDFGQTIAGVPYEGGYRCPHGPVDYFLLRSKTARKFAQSMFRRILKQRRVADAGAQSTINVLANLDSTREGLPQLLLGFGVSNTDEHAEYILDNPGLFERELGSLITAQRLQGRIRLIRDQIFQEEGAHESEQSSN